MLNKLVLLFNFVIIKDTVTLIRTTVF